MQCSAHENTSGHADEQLLPTFFSQSWGMETPQTCSVRGGYEPGTQGSWICATSDLRKQMREQKVHCMSRMWSLSYIQMFIVETILLLSW